MPQAWSREASGPSGWSDIREMWCPRRCNACMRRNEACSIPPRLVHWMMVRMRNCLEKIRNSEERKRGGGGGAKDKSLNHRCLIPQPGESSSSSASHTRRTKTRDKALERLVKSKQTGPDGGDAGQHKSANSQGRMERKGKKQDKEKATQH